jgi:hypothetical protein
MQAAEEALYLICHDTNHVPVRISHGVITVQLMIEEVGREADPVAIVNEYWHEEDPVELYHTSCHLHPLSFTPQGKAVSVPVERVIAQQ